MAKVKIAEPLEAVAEDAEGNIVPLVETTPIAEDAPPAVPLPRWKISPKSGSSGPELVEAATIEDAIRVYNGNSGAFARKQLDIEAV